MISVRINDSRWRLRSSLPPMACVVAALALASPAIAQTGTANPPPVDVTFTFGADVHICWNGYTEDGTYCVNGEQDKTRANVMAFIDATNVFATNSGNYGWRGASFTRYSDASQQNVTFQDGGCAGQGCSMEASKALVISGDLTDLAGGCIGADAYKGTSFVGDPGSQLAALTCFFDSDNNGLCDDSNGASSPKPFYRFPPSICRTNARSAFNSIRL